MIELQGEQHFLHVRHFHGETGFQEGQDRDKIKKDYIAAKPNHYLVRISYLCLGWIDRILTRVLANPTRSWSFVMRDVDMDDEGATFTEEEATIVGVYRL